MKRTPSRSPRPVLPDHALTTLLEGVAPVRLSAARQAAMKKALLGRAAEPPILTMRPANGHWVAMAPKVDMQVLHDDGVHASWLVRVQPGGRLPAHDHRHGPEECIVISGSCHLDGEFLRAGDYQCAPAGSRHVDVHSDEGCMLFIRSPSFKPRAHAPHTGALRA